MASAFWSAEKEDTGGYDRPAMQERMRKRKAALRRGDARDIALTAPRAEAPCRLLADAANPPISREAAEGMKRISGSVLDELNRERERERQHVRPPTPSPAERLVAQIEELQLRGAFGLDGGDASTAHLIGQLMRGMPGRALVVPACRIMTSLDVSDRSLGNDFALVMAGFLRLAECPLCSLAMANTRMNTEGAQALGEALRSNSLLMELTLVHSPLPVQVVRGSEDHFTDTRVALAGLRLESLDANVIGCLLQDNDMIDALDLGDNRLTEQSSDWGEQAGRYFGLLSIVRSAVMLDTITDFDLSHNALMNEGLDMVCQLISVSGVLRRLNLAGNDAGLNNAHRKVSGHGTEALAQALLCSRGLQHLDLSDNEFDGEDAVLLCSALRAQDTLLSLDFAMNPVGPYGAIAVADALDDNQRLEGLSLHTCRLADAGVEAVAKSLRARNRTVHRLNLSNNGATEPAARAVLAAMEENPAVTQLDFTIDTDTTSGVLDEGNPIVSQAVAFAEANKDFQRMIEDPVAVDFKKMKLAGKMNVFRKHKYIDVVRPGATQLLLTQNKSFVQQKIKGAKTPMHFYADLGERQMVKDIAAMWQLPRSMWMDDEIARSKLRAKQQRVRSMLEGKLLSYKLLMWERFRVQLERCIGNYKNPTPFKFGPDMVPGFQMRIFEWPDEDSQEYAQVQAGPMMLNGEPVRAVADYGDWLEIRFEDEDGNPYHHAFTRRIVAEDGRVILVHSERKHYTAVASLDFRMAEDLYVKKAYSPQTFDAHVQLSLRKAVAQEVTALLGGGEGPEGRLSADDVDVVSITQATRIMRSRLVDCGVEVTVDVNLVQPDSIEGMKPWADQLRHSSDELKSMDNRIRKQIALDQHGKQPRKFQLEVKHAMREREFVLDDPDADDVIAHQRDGNLMYQRRQFVADLTHEELVATLKVQAKCRGDCARKRARALINEVYERVWSTEYAAFYYLNTNTGETSWEKPRLLKGDDDIVMEGDAAKMANRFKVKSKLPKVDKWKAMMAE